MQNCLPFDLYLIFRVRLTKDVPTQLRCFLQVIKVTIHERKIFTIHTQETVY